MQITERLPHFLFADVMPEFGYVHIANHDGLWHAWYASAKGDGVASIIVRAKGLSIEQALTKLQAGMVEVKRALARAT